jgi:hypothetical protein
MTEHYMDDICTTCTHTRSWHYKAGPCGNACPCKKFTSEPSPAERLVEACRRVTIGGQMITVNSIHGLLLEDARLDNLRNALAAVEKEGKHERRAH